MAVNRIQRELAEMENDPPENCSAKLIKNNLFKWEATIIGPKGTSYEDGVFKLNIQFSDDHPFTPPVVTFVTPIYHLNIAPKGKICMDLLTTEWSPILTISKVLVAILSLLCDPNPEHACNTEAGAYYRKDYKKYYKRAREWTEKHAMK